MFILSIVNASWFAFAGFVNMTHVEAHKTNAILWKDRISAIKKIDALGECLT